MDEEEFDRQPPQDLAAEQAFLGAVLLSEHALAQAVDAVRVDELYRPAHATIWATCLEMYAGSDPVDVITVSDRLTSDGELMRIGGLPYLHTLISDVPTVANVGHYAAIIRRKAMQRQGVEIGTRIVTESYAWPDDEEGLAARIEAEASKLTARYTGPSSLVNLDDAVDEAFERLAGPMPTTISTGLPDLDDILAGGLVPGDVYVIAARPGLGKSLVGSNIALNVAKSGLGVLFCSLEMGAAQVTDRILANEAGVELSAIKRHRLNDLDWHLLKRAKDKFRGAPFQILDTPNLTIAAARRHGERVSRRYGGLGLVVIDYAQLMTPTDPGKPREQQVAEICNGAKQLDLGCPVVLISQTNRKDGERETPAMGDLRESGSLEAVASAVVIIRRPAEPERVGELDLHVVKNRHDREGVVTVSYSPHYSRVRSLAREQRSEEAA